MDIKIEKRERYTLIQVLVDKLDTKIAPALKAELVLVTGSGENNLVLDVSRCNFCDSAGLSSILVANRLCKNSNGVFVIGGIQPEIERLITISQSDKVLNIAYRIERADHMMNSLLE